MQHPKALAVMAAILAVMFEPPREVLPSAWARDNMIVADGPRAGLKWDADLTPQLVPVLDTLVALDWIAPLAEDGDGGDPRYVLLADPSTPIEPLLEALLMPKAEPLEDLWQKGPLRSLRLGDVLLI